MNLEAVAGLVRQLDAEVPKEGAWAWIERTEKFRGFCVHGTQLGLFRFGIEAMQASLRLPDGKSTFDFAEVAANAQKSEEDFEQAFNEQTAKYLQAEACIIFRRDDATCRMPRPPCAPPAPPPQPTSLRQVLAAIGLLFFACSSIVGIATVLEWLSGWVAALINGQSRG